MDDAAIFQQGPLPQRAALLQRLLSEARTRNDARVSPEETACIRGEITVYKKLLGFLTGETQAIDEEPRY